MSPTWALDLTQLIMSFGSFCLATWAVARGLGNWRVYHAVVAVLSLVYFTGYAHLLVFQPDIAVWSPRMRGVGLLTWPLVWGWGSVLSIQNQRKINRLAEVVKDYKL